MLDFMRRRRSTLKWVWVILIFIFSVTLITLYIPFDDLGNVSITNDVAKIGSDSISAHEFQSAYRNYISRMNGQLTPDMMKAFRFDRQVVDALVDRHVISEEAKRLGLTASPLEIEQKILENPIFRQNGNFIGHAQYQMILAQNNVTVDEFESSVRDEIVGEKLKSFVTAGVDVTDDEVQKEYERRNQKAKIEYLVIDASMAQDKLSVSDQEQREYYEKNKAKYTTPEKRQAQYIFVAAQKLRPDIQVSDDDLRQYYSQHGTDYQLPERIKAQHILFKTQGKKPEEIEAIRKKAQGVLDRVKKGEDFSQLAKEFSEDPDSAPKGGDLGLVPRGLMRPEIEKIAFNLNPGQVSDLVTSPLGFHIIKVNSKEPPSQRPFGDVKEVVRSIVTGLKADEKARDEAQQISADLVSNKDLNSVAQKYKAEVKETALLTQNQQAPELNEEFIRRVFTMSKGEIGTAMQVPNGWAVPMLAEIVATHPASFEEAKASVETDAKAEKARQLAIDKGKQVQDLIKSGKDIEATGKAVGAEVKTSEFLTRGASLPGYGPVDEIEKDMFSLPIGKTGTPVTVAGKTIAFSVKERQDVKPEDLKNNMAVTRSQLLPAKRDQYFQAFIQDVRKKMEAAGTIKVNEAVATEIARTTTS